MVQVSVIKVFYFKMAFKLIINTSQLFITNDVLLIFFTNNLFQSFLSVTYQLAKKTLTPLLMQMLVCLSLIWYCVCLFVMLYSLLDFSQSISLKLGV